MAYLIRDKDGRPVVTKDGTNVLGVDNHDNVELKDFDDKERSLLAVASSESPDRFKDVIMAKGWELGNYRKNPVVMAFHMYHTLPVGRSLEEFTRRKANVNQLMFRPQFAAYPESVRMYEMYRDKYLRGFSVGFLPKKSEPMKKKDDEKEEDDHPFFHTPIRFKVQELLEVSVAPIPASPDALSEIKTMVQKGKIYVPARYLRDEQVPETEVYDNYVHVKVEDESRFISLFEDVIGENVIRVYGTTSETKNEFVNHKFIFSRDKYDEESARDSIGVLAEEAYEPFNGTHKIHDPNPYMAKETVLIESLPALEDKDFEEPEREELDIGVNGGNAVQNDVIVLQSSDVHTSNADESKDAAIVKVEKDSMKKGEDGQVEIEYDENGKPHVTVKKEEENIECGDCLEMLAQEYVVGKDIEFAEEEYIGEEDVEEKPYPNEHSCRLLPPGDFDRFARKNCWRKSNGKCIDFIFGIKAGKSKTQAMRYPKGTWEASAARSHCKGAGGTFEAASKDAKIFVYSVDLQLEGKALARIKEGLQAVLGEDAKIIVLDSGATLACVEGEVNITYVSKEGVQIKEEKGDQKIKCQNCGVFIDYEKEPEIAMGAIKCPKCGVIINQEGEVLDKGEEDDDLVVNEIKILTEEFKSMKESLIDEVVERVIRAVRSTLEEENKKNKKEKPLNKIEEEEIEEEDLFAEDDLDEELEIETNEDDEIDLEEAKEVISDAVKTVLGRLD